MSMSRPDGVTEDGEIVDENAYASYLEMMDGEEEVGGETTTRNARTQEAVRREEVNINHSRNDREHSYDEPGDFF